MPKDVPSACSSSSSASSDKTIASEREKVRQPGAPSCNPCESAVRLAQLLRERILENIPSAKITNAQLRQWEIIADRMMRIDKRPENDVASLIDWAHRDSFWCKNILSMGKLREKFDQLTIYRHGRRADGADAQALEQADDKPAPPRWKGLYDDAKKEPDR